jgi:hypothetical protein
VSTPYELVASLLEKVKRTGKTLTARCPAHDDRHNSLSVSEGDQTGLADSADWFECKHGPRAAAQSPANDLPLFQGVRR